MLNRKRDETMLRALREHGLFWFCARDDGEPVGGIEDGGRDGADVREAGFREKAAEFKVLGNASTRGSFIQIHLLPAWRSG